MRNTFVIQEYMPMTDAMNCIILERDVVVIQAQVGIIGRIQF